MTPFYSLFKTEGIILSIDTVRDNNTRVIFLSKEYGKISSWYKKKQFLHDIGDIVFITLERQGAINTIKYTESIMSPREEAWSYEKISTFLESLALMNTLIPEMSPYMNIFKDYKGLLVHMQESMSLHTHHYLLFQFRVLRTLGYIGSESFESSPIPLYIFNNILKTPLTKLLSAKTLKDEDAKKIKLANREAVYRSIL